MNLPVKKWDRYINSELLSCIQRPQPYNYCSLSCIQAILLYFGVVQQYNEIIYYCDVNKPNILKGRIGNSNVMSFLTQYKLKSELYNRDNPIDWNSLKSLITNNIPIIYHSPGHYSLVVGVIEEPVLRNNGDHVLFHANKTQKWIVLGEHRVKKNTTRERGMIELVSWNKYQKVIATKKNYALIVCQK